MNYSRREAALSLDIAGGAVGYYCAGERKMGGEILMVEVPLIVLLACAALEKGIEPIC